MFRWVPFMMFMGLGVYEAGSDWGWGVWLLLLVLSTASAWWAANPARDRARAARMQRSKTTANEPPC